MPTARYNERTVRVAASGKQQVCSSTLSWPNSTALSWRHQGVNLSRRAYQNWVSRWSVCPAQSPIALPTRAALFRARVRQESLSGTTSPSGIVPAGGQLIPLLLSSNVTYGLAAQNSNIAWQGFFPVSRRSQPRQSSRGAAFAGELRWKEKPSSFRVARYQS